MEIPNLYVTTRDLIINSLKPFLIDDVIGIINSFIFQDRSRRGETRHTMFGKLHGLRTYYHSNILNHTIYHQCSFKHGKKDGLERKFKKSMLWYECMWRDGEKDGSEREWRHNKLIIHNQYMLGKLHGYCFDVASSCTWKFGRQHGQETIKFNDGTTFITRDWVNGQQHGVEKQWLHNGTPIVEKHFDRGKLHGYYETWNPNGYTYGKTLYDHGKVVKYPILHRLSKWFRII